MTRSIGSNTSAPSNPPEPPAWMAIAQSPIGKKILTGVTGLGLVTFIVVHMLGNLVFFVSADAYNRYAYKLEQLTPLVWTVEGFLLIGTLVHAVLGVQIYLNKRRARTIHYDTYQSAGAPSHQTLSSITMIWTGGLLALFIIWHLLTFKFGTHYPLSASMDSQAASGTSTFGPTRDLARLVVESFRQPLYTFSYTGFLVLLGFHLRHGIWSAFQSMGVLNKASRLWMTTVSTVGAIAISVGFLALPWAIYLGWIG